MRTALILRLLADLATLGRAGVVLLLLLRVGEGLGLPRAGEAALSLLPSVRGRPSGRAPL